MHPEIETWYRGLYDENYARLNAKHSTVMMSPSDEVVEARKHAKLGIGLDIGCGRGGNTLFLAEAGFKMKAFDLSPSAIKNLREEAEKRRLEIEAVAGNFLHELLPFKFNIVVASYIFDHFEEDEAHYIVRRMQEKTQKGGVNVVTTFGHGTIEHPDAAIRHHHFKMDELLRLYRGWQIIRCEKTRKNDMNLPHKFPVLKLVAKKTAA